METNLASIVWTQSAKTPDHCFVEGVSRSYSYKQAQTAIACMAQVLLAQGVVAGDRVIILSPNSPEALLLFMACYAVGAIAVLLHEDTTSVTLAHIETETDPVLIYTDEQLQQLVIESQKKRLIQSSCLFDYEQNAGDFLPVAVSDKTPAFIVYTSGSTGKPKGVTLSHKNVLFVVGAIQQRLNYRTTDKVGIFIPLSFDYGLYQTFLCAQVGATVFLRNSTFTGPVLPGLIDKHQLTVLPGLPNMFETLITLAQRRHMTLDCLEKISNTGAHLPASFIEDLKKIAPNANIYPMYGLTECKRVSILLPEEMQMHPGSCGRPLQGTEAWVIREDGNRAEAGEVGELVVKGPHVSLGYWNSAEETQKRFKIDMDGEPLLLTGDQFTQDDEGFLYYVTRLDNQIKRNGFRLNKLEIEAAALDISGINNAVLIQSAKKLVLFLTTDLELSSTDVMKAMMQQLETYKLPDEIRFVTEIKSTKNGKVDIAGMEALI